MSKAETPRGAFSIRDCGCVAIAEWFDGSQVDQRKAWTRFKAKAKRSGYAVESFNEKPERDWLCIPHRAAHEAYKAAKTAQQLIFHTP